MAPPGNADQNSLRLRPEARPPATSGAIAGISVPSRISPVDVVACLRRLVEVGQNIWLPAGSTTRIDGKPMLPMATISTFVPSRFERRMVPPPPTLVQ